MGTGLRMEGIKALDDILRSLPSSTAKGVAKRAMKRSLEPVMQAAIAATPFEGIKKTIGISSKLTRRQASQARGKEDRDTQIMYVGSNSPLAHLLEFGTGLRHHKSGKSVGTMAPQPFMRVAWDSKAQAVLERLSADLRIEIDKTIARRAKRAAGAGS